MNREPKAGVDPADADRDYDELSRVLCDGLAAAELPPSRRAGLRDTFLERVRESVHRHAGLLVVRATDGVWRKIKSGVRAKLLWEGAAGASVLIELAPGSSLPPHRHRQLEEGIVLCGSLQLDDLVLGPGDYHVSPPGSRHHRISSTAGGVAYLRGTSLGDRRKVIGELVGGLLPGDGPPVHTVLGAQCRWQAVAPGVEISVLWRDGETVSRFVRLAPGSRLAGHPHPVDEECMMLSGDAFFGDLLVQAGEFHLAPAGSVHHEISSDEGALLFVRGRMTPTALQPT